MEINERDRGGATIDMRPMGWLPLPPTPDLSDAEEPGEEDEEE